jgi:hypothetical protein
MKIEDFALEESAKRADAQRRLLPACLCPAHSSQHR